MDSNSDISPSSPPPPSFEAYNAVESLEATEPEEYNTGLDSAVATEKTLLPEGNSLTSSSAMENQKAVSEDEGEVHDSSPKEVWEENSDSVLIGETKVEDKDGKEKNMASLPHNPIGSHDSGGDEVAKHVEYEVNDSRAEEGAHLDGEIKNGSTFITEGSQEPGPMETGQDDSKDITMEPKSIEASESGDQSAFEELEPNGSEAKYIFVAGEVEAGTQQGFDAVVVEEEKLITASEVLPADGNVLEDNTAVEVEPEAVKIKAEPNANGTEMVESFVDDSNAREIIVSGDEKSIGAGSLLNADAPESDSIDSLNDKPSGNGEGLVESTRIVDPEPVMINVDKPDQMNCSEISERSASLNQEFVDEKVVIDSEHVSSHGEGEHLTAVAEIFPVNTNETAVGDGNTQEFTDDKVVASLEHDSILGEGKAAVESNEDVDLNSNVVVATLPVPAKEFVVGDESTIETAIEDDVGLNSNVVVATLPFPAKEIVAGDESTPETSIEDDGDLNSNVVATLPVTVKEYVVGDESTPETATETLPQVFELDQKVKLDTDESQVGDVDEEKDDEDEVGKISEGPARVAILDSPEAKHIIFEMERISSNSQSGFQGSPSSAGGQNASDFDEVLDSDDDGEGGELFDSAALAALLKAATGSSDGTVTVTPQDAARIFSVDRPAGLGTAPSLRPAASRLTRSSLFAPSEIATVSEASYTMDDDEKRLHEKVEQIRVKFLRLVHRLGHSPEDTVAAQVLYRLSLAEGIRQGRQVSRAFSIESAKKQALLLEGEGKDDLDFSCNILVLGKTGVGKSATINSIFGEERSRTNPFQQATTSVREISGVVDGVRIRIVDTPGLKASIMDQAANRKILSSIKKFTKKCPPDIVLYVDRMDTQTRDFNDLPLLRSITSILGSSIWFNAIVALTHAASAPPDGPNGSPLGYEVFVTQRSHVVQQSIRQAAGDMRLMNPVALVENHPSCRRNREGERILPNGLSWRPQLLLLCYSSKILSEANSLLKLQDPSPGKLFGFRLRSPPLPFLLSSLLQSRAHPKLSGDHGGGDNADSDIDLDDFSDAEQEEEDEYDELPPFKPLKKAQIAKLTKEQRKAYFDEYDYRVKLLQKKQWKEEIRRLKENKKKGKDSTDEFANSDMPEDYDQDGSPAAVQVPLPDMVLPPSFDCDHPAYRYRFLEPTSQLLTRPVLDTHGWDHDCGYDGVSIEESLAIVGRFPTSMAIQITKDKKEFNIHLDSSIAAKHGESGSTLAGFDIQSVGKQLAYIFRGETKFKNLKKNKTAAGISVTFLGETIATGLKVEDRISIGKRLGLVASTGAIRAQGDVAFGANLEARLRDKDYPIGQVLSTLGLSLMKWRNDLALGANLQSQFSVGRNSKMAVRVGLNNKLSGQVTVRTSTSEQLQIAVAGIIPLAIYLYRTIRSSESYLDH